MFVKSSLQFKTVHNKNGGKVFLKFNHYKTKNAVMHCHTIQCQFLCKPQKQLIIKLLNLTNGGSV